MQTLLDQLVYQPIQPPKATQIPEASRPWISQLPPKQEIKVTVKILKGETLQLNVNPLDTIESLKDTIQEQTGHQTRLVYKGKPLVTTVYDYNLQDKQIHASIKSTTPQQTTVQEPSKPVEKEPILAQPSAFWSAIQSVVDEHVSPNDRALVIQSFKNAFPSQ